eukprot:PITA_23614
MTPDKFRPIALCNVVYKIISKVVANKLKALLPALVSDEQTGFVEGRQILNNIIQAHEVVDSLKRNKQAALPTPKGGMQQIRSIQRDFLWGKGEEKNKWALVAWDKLCKPKAHGGLGLHDPEILSRVSGAKLWWRWLKESTTPWAKLWKKKYANNW